MNTPKQSQTPKLTDMWEMEKKKEKNVRNEGKLIGTFFFFWEMRHKLSMVFVSKYTMSGKEVTN